MGDRKHGEQCQKTRACDARVMRESCTQQGHGSQLFRSPRVEAAHIMLQKSWMKCMASFKAQCNCEFSILIKVRLNCERPTATDPARSWARIRKIKSCTASSYRQRELKRTRMYHSTSCNWAFTTRWLAITTDRGIQRSMMQNVKQLAGQYGFYNGCLS